MVCAVAEKRSRQFKPIVEAQMCILRRATRSLVFSFVVLLFVLQPVALAGGGQAAETAALTNDDVIKMVEAKLPDGVIVAKIKSSACKFDTSLDALIKLRQAGISDIVMQAMTEAGAPAASTNPAPAVNQPPPDPNDPLAEHDPGIYYVRQNPGGRQMTAIEPTAYSGAKTGGVFTSGLTYGIKKAKWKALVRGARANLRITEPEPTFYFYFEQKHGTLSYAGGAGSWFGGLSTPNQFSLVRLESKKDNRELIVGEFGAYGASSGTRSKDLTEFDYEKVAPGIYKVVPRAEMRPGEYCFFYTGQATPVGPMGGGGGGGMLFDFGINPPE
jgi:hypothetical protein